jgi:hypothetical protein
MSINLSIVSFRKQKYFAPMLWFVMTLFSVRIFATTPDLCNFTFDENKKKIDLQKAAMLELRDKYVVQFKMVNFYVTEMREYGSRCVEQLLLEGHFKVELKFNFKLCKTEIKVNKIEHYAEDKYIYTVSGLNTNMTCEKEPP